jgi:DNA-binding MarR family transcriptional regulator
MSAAATATSVEKYLIYVHFLAQSKRRLFGLAAEHGLTGMQGLMLLMLDRPVPMQRFKSLFNCDASNVTGLADGLEQKGYLARYESEHDRRTKMLRLTHDGEELRKAYARELMSDDTPLMSALDSEEQATLFNLFGKVLAYEDI